MMGRLDRAGSAVAVLASTKEEIAAAQSAGPASTAGKMVDTVSHLAFCFPRRAAPKQSRGCTTSRNRPSHGSVEIMQSRMSGSPLAFWLTTGLLTLCSRFGTLFAPAAAPAPAVAAAPAASALPAGVSQIAMPALSSTMKEGKIVQWTKSVGDRCKPMQWSLFFVSFKSQLAYFGCV